MNVRTDVTAVTVSVGRNRKNRSFIIIGIILTIILCSLTYFGVRTGCAFGFLEEEWRGICRNIAWLERFGREADRDQNNHPVIVRPIVVVTVVKILPPPDRDPRPTRVVRPTRPPQPTSVPTAQQTIAPTSIPTDLPPQPTETPIPVPTVPEVTPVVPPTEAPPIPTVAPLPTKKTKPTPAP